MLRNSDPPIAKSSSWELVISANLDVPGNAYLFVSDFVQVRLRFENEDAFRDVPEEVERLFIFKDFIKTLEVCCLFSYVLVGLIPW